MRTPRSDDSQAVKFALCFPALADAEILPDR